MDKCKLCLINDADKTGSHIVPAFILKTLFERNKELVVTITNESNTSHVGREVLPEKIEDFMGRELTDEELSVNHIPFVADHVFCSSCEVRLGHLESLYAQVIHQKIDKLKVEENKIHEIKNRASLASIFWYSVIWRLSIHKENTYHLKLKDEKKLRFFLNSVLTSNLDSLKTNLLAESPNSCKFPMALFFNSNSINKITSNFVSGDIAYVNPYLVFVNEYVIILYMKSSQIRGMKHTFFGIEEAFELTDLVNHGEVENFLFGLIKDDHWEKIKGRVMKCFANIRHKELAFKFRYIANHYNLEYSPLNIKNFIDKVIDKETHIADKYEKTRVAEILKEELKKLPIKKYL